jgi:hypothetical protein
MIDSWLDYWLPLVVGKSNNSPILALGCGKGADSTTLLASGLSLVAIDQSKTGSKQLKMLIGRILKKSVNPSKMLKL